MYRVLILDDESLIVDGVYEYLYARRSEEFDLVRAYAPEAALRLLSRMRIDIVVTDIEMPLLDGLAVHEVVRRQWPRARVIFLTAHSEFDYVYYSTKFPNTRFILKSEGFPALLSLLDETARELSEELLDRPPGEDRCAGPSRPGESVLRSLTEARDWEAGLIARYHGPLETEKPVLPVLLFCCGLPEEGNETGLEEYLRAQFGHKATFDLLYLGVRETLVLCQTEDMEETGFVEQTLELVLGALESILKTPVAAAALESAAEWETLPAARQALERCCRDHLEDGVSVVCIVDAAVLNRERGRILLEKMAAAAQEGDTSRAWDHFAQFSHLAGAGNAGRSAFWRRDALETFSVLLARTGLLQQADTSALICGLQGNEWDLGLLSALLEKILLAAPDTDANRQDALSIMLDRLDRTIEEQYDTDLSLADLAGSVYLSASYVSRVYKQQRGINLVDKIQQVRIRHAQELLSRTNMKIQDIAAKTGFHSPRYFINVFRKCTGINPKEFRECNHWTK